MIAPKIGKNSEPQSWARPQHHPRTKPKTNWILLVVAVCAVSLIYTVVYATATTRGYSRAQMTTQLRQLQTQNQLLETQVHQMENPARIANLAQNSGMVMDCQVQYLGKTKTYASNPIHSDIYNNTNP